MNSITSALVVIGTAIVGVAALSVLVSKNANTSQVITSASNGFGNSILAAVSPVTGQMPTLSNGML